MIHDDGQFPLLSARTYAYVPPYLARMQDSAVAGSSGAAAMVSSRETDQTTMQVSSLQVGPHDPNPVLQSQASPWWVDAL